MRIQKYDGPPRRMYIRHHRRQLGGHNYPAAR